MRRLLDLLPPGAHVLDLGSGTGVPTARQLVAAGMQWARATGASRMLLEVHEDNDAALGLYDGCGFRQLSRRENYYGPGVHALVMAAPLADEENEAEHG